ncbi:hypothetical protein YC2023_066686 [Brassica napus]
MVISVSWLIKLLPRHSSCFHDILTNPPIACVSFLDLDRVIGPFGKARTSPSVGLSRSSSSPLASWSMITSGSLQHTVYISSKDETFSELEPKLDRGGGILVPVTVGITVETWLCGFLLPRDYSEEQLLKQSEIQPSSPHQSYLLQHQPLPLPTHY